MFPSPGEGRAPALLGLLRKPPDVGPAPCFSLRDFKETCTEDFLIPPSPGEEAVLSPGWGGEGLIHCGSRKSGAG